MYWTGKAGGPNGENFSFFVEWVATQNNFAFENNGFLIPLNVPNGNVTVWVTKDTMRSLVEHDPSVLRIILSKIQAEHALEVELNLKRVEGLSGFPERIETPESLDVPLPSSEPS